MYTLLKKDKNTKARLGRITTAHGDIETPFFMPVGTNGTVKTLLFEDLHEMNAQLLLSNTYHLYLRPGMDVINHAGGLHKFAGWEKPILTDSGGYQVFSLTKFRKLMDDGVEFSSHLDGSKHFLTPEKVIEIQQVLGSNMMMPLDICAPYPCEEREAVHSVERTTEWARRSKEYFLNNRNKSRHQQNLFGIIQGATYKDLRERSTKELVDLDLDGYAIGGVSVGEPVKDMFETLEWVMPHLPDDKAHYFMGIGLPDQMVKAVGEGIDMFDTVLPTRFGRHATAFTRMGRKILRNAEFTNDQGPIDESCECFVCKKYAQNYIRHLANNKEISALRLIAYHNLFFYVNLMKDIREAIKQDCYDKFQKEFLENYGSELAGAQSAV